MNLWIVNHYAITSEMSGSTRHYDFAVELIRRGHSVTIFSSSFRHQGKRIDSKLKKNEKWKYENINGINFIWLKTFPYKKNNWRRITNMLSFAYKAYWLGKKITKLNENIQKPNIVIGSSPHLLTTLTAYFLSKHYKINFIMEVRDLWPLVLLEIGGFKKHSLIIKGLKILEKFLYKHAKKIIVLMPFAKNYIVPLGVDKSKIVWICNGVDLKKFSLLNKKLTNKQFSIIYFGAHGAANILNIILDAAKIIQDKGYKKIRFVFIGSGPEKQGLIKYGKGLKLRNAEFKKPVPKKEASHVLNKADVLITCFGKIGIYEKYGTSSNKLFDYMATGKPIVMSGRPANDIVNKIGCGISVPPENAKELADAIIKLYRMHSGARAKMGQRGRKYVEEYHSITVLVDKLEKIIYESTN